MANRTIKFGFNHMVCPSLSPEELVDAAEQVGAVAIELRNDIGDNSLRRRRHRSPRRRKGRRIEGSKFAASTPSIPSTSGTKSARVRPKVSPSSPPHAGRPAW